MARPAKAYEKILEESRFDALKNVHTKVDTAMSRTLLAVFLASVSCVSFAAGPTWVSTQDSPTNVYDVLDADDIALGDVELRTGIHPSAIAMGRDITVVAAQRLGAADGAGHNFLDYLGHPIDPGSRLTVPCGYDGVQGNNCRTLVVAVTDHQRVVKSIGFPVISLSGYDWQYAFDISKVAVHPSGAIAVAGTYRGGLQILTTRPWRLASPTEERAGFVVFLDPQLQLRRVVPLPSFDDLSAGPDGFVVVGGARDGSPEGRIISFTREGDTAWLVTTKSSPHPNGTMLTPYSVSVNASGEVAVSGAFYDAIQVARHSVTARNRAATFVVHLTSSGKVRWVAGLDEHPIELPAVTQVLITSASSVYVSSSSARDGMSGTDLVKLGFAGRVDWARRLFGHSYCSDSCPVRDISEAPQDGILLSVQILDHVTIEGRHLHYSPLLLVIDRFGEVTQAQVPVLDAGWVNADHWLHPADRHFALGADGVHGIMDFATAVDSFTDMSPDGFRLRTFATRVPTKQTSLRLSSSPRLRAALGGTEDYGIERLLNFSDRTAYLGDVRTTAVAHQVAEEDSSDSFLVLHYRGIGYSHAVLSVVVANQPEPTYASHWRVVGSYGMWSQNDAVGKRASLGEVRDTSTTYTDGLLLYLGALSEADASALLRSPRSSKVVFQISAEQTTAILAELETLGPRLQWSQLDGIETHDRFLGGASGRLRRLLAVVGLTYPNEWNNLAPQQVFAAFAHDGRWAMVAVQDWTEVLGIGAENERSVTAHDEYYGPLQYGLAHGEGRVRFEQRLVWQPTGWVRWLRYEGGFAEGVFEGQGALVYEVFEGQGPLMHEDMDGLDDLLYSCRQYVGSFSGGRPHGRGTVKSCEEGRVLAGGVFESGRLVTGMTYSYSYSQFGVLQREEQYTDGRLDGDAVEFCSDGATVRRVTTYSAGQKMGARLYLYDGVVDWLSHYSDPPGWFDWSGSCSGQLAYIWETDNDLMGSGEIERREELEREVLESGIPMPREFVYSKATQIVVGKQSTVMHHDGWTLRSEIDEVGELRGHYAMTRADGGVLRGEMRDGWIGGPAKYRTPSGDEQDVVVDENGGFSYTVYEEREKGTLGLELGAAGSLLGEAVGYSFGVPFLGGLAGGALGCAVGSVIDGEFSCYIGTRSNLDGENNTSAAGPAGRQPSSEARPEQSSLSKGDLSPASVGLLDELAEIDGARDVARYVLTFATWLGLTGYSAPLGVGNLERNVDGIGEFGNRAACASKKLLEVRIYNGNTNKAPWKTRGERAYFMTLYRDSAKVCSGQRP